MRYRGGKSRGGSHRRALVRAAGASWAAIARALGVSKQAAWADHTRWIDAQSELSGRPGHEGLDPDEIARLRRVAGSPDDDPGP